LSVSAAHYKKEDAGQKTKPSQEDNPLAILSDAL
jgi:hypothetical protein